MSEMMYLLQFGDSIEREAISYGLGVKFPQYAEFWAWYVFPNRDASNPFKLRQGFPQELEKLFNTHYGVWHQLTVAYRQLRNLNSGIVDFSDPLFHLGTAIDLVERVFVQALSLKAKAEGKDFVTPLTKAEFDHEVERFWSQEYAEKFKKFRGRSKPVNLNLHGIEKLFNSIAPDPEGLKQFKTVSNQIREYRNLLIHYLSPLRLKKENSVYIPYPLQLNRYAEANWSSGIEELNPDHFGPAGQIIQDLADRLTGTISGIWPMLLEVMNYIADSEVFRAELQSFRVDSGESGLVQYAEPRRTQYPYHGGTIEFDASRYQPPQNPSGYVDLDGKPVKPR